MLPLPAAKGEKSSKKVKSELSEPTKDIAQLISPPLKKKQKKDPLAEFAAGEKADQILNTERLKNIHTEEMLRMESRREAKQQDYELKAKKLALKEKKIDLEMQRLRALGPALDPSLGSSSSRSAPPSPYVPGFDLGGIDLGMLDTPDASVPYDSFSLGTY